MVSKAITVLGLACIVLIVVWMLAIAVANADTPPHTGTVSDQRDVLRFSVRDRTVHRDSAPMAADAVVSFFVYIDGKQATQNCTNDDAPAQSAVCLRRGVVVMLTARKKDGPIRVSAAGLKGGTHRVRVVLRW